MNRLRTNEATGFGFVTSHDAVGRAFRGAARHSRLVHILRIAIPVGVLLCLLAIVGATFFNPLRFLNKLPDFSGLVISGTKVTMESPRLAGFTKNSRAYELTAQAAAQDFANPNVVELTEILAKLHMQDQSVTEMTAYNGVYDTKEERLKLGPKVRLSSPTYEALLGETFLEVRAGHIISEEPVEVKMLRGTLNANRIEVFNSGEVLRFDSGVNMLLLPESADKSKSGTDTQ